LRAENQEYLRLQAQSHELDQLRQDNAALQRLRAEAGQLRAELAELERLRAENRRLRAAFPGAVLIKDMAKAKAASEAETCLNHLRQIELSGQTWALDHEGLYPRDFACMSNELSTPIILHCPSDKARATPRLWEDAPIEKVSYQLVSPGTKPEEGKVFAWCSLHRQGVSAQGRVAGPSLEDAVVERVPQTKDR
jgi:hypothetical protein